jgi:DNA-binding protein Fis
MDEINPLVVARCSVAGVFYPQINKGDCTVKETIKQMLASEAKYDDIIKEVTEEVISQALVKARGNQTLAAELLGMNRGTFRKYLNRMGSK